MRRYDEPRQVERVADVVNGFCGCADRKGDGIERETEAVFKIEIVFALVAAARHEVQVEIPGLFLRGEGRLVRGEGGEIDLVVRFVHLHEAVPGIAAVVAELVVDEHTDDGIAEVVRKIDEPGAVVVPARDHEHVVVLFRHTPDAFALLVQIALVRLGSAAREDVVRGDDCGVIGVLGEDAVQPGELPVVGFVHQLDEEIGVAAALHEGVAAHLAAVSADRFEVYLIAVALHCLRVSAVRTEIFLITRQIRTAEVVIAGNEGDRDTRLCEGKERLLGALPLHVVVPVFHEVAHMRKPFEVYFALIFDQPRRRRVGYFGREFDGVLRIGEEGERVVIFALQLVFLIVPERTDVVFRVQQPLLLRERALRNADLLQIAAQKFRYEVVFRRIRPFVEVVGDDRADAEIAAVCRRIHAVHAAARIVAEGVARIGVRLQLAPVAVAGDGDVVPGAAVVHRKTPQRAVELGIGAVLRHVLNLFAVGDVDLHRAVMPFIVPLPAAEVRARAFARQDIHPCVRSVVVDGHHEHEFDGIPVHERFLVDRGFVRRAQVCVFEIVEDILFPLIPGKGVELLLILLFEAVELHALRVARHRNILECEEVGGFRPVFGGDDFQIVAFPARVFDHERVVLERAGRIFFAEFPVRVDVRLFALRFRSVRAEQRNSVQQGEDARQQQCDGKRRCEQLRVFAFCLHKTLLSNFTIAIIPCTCNKIFRQFPAFCKQL